MKNYKNPFIFLLLGWAVLVGTPSMAQDTEVPQEQRAGETHFLVFAPNPFEYLHQAPEFQNGMRMISEQLTRSGLPEQNVVLLHGQTGTIANLRRELRRLASVPREDRIVLFVLTHGINVNGKDYLADQKTSRNGFLSGAENEMIAVSEIVDTLGKSPAEHKWVLIDTAALGLPIEDVSVEKGVFVIADSDTSDNVLANYSDDAFGTSPLQVPNDFVVSINRGRRIHQSTDEDFVSSVFLRSFIFAISTEDRFARYEQHVSLKETLDTMNRFLAANHHPAPVVSGSFDSNALLLPNRAESAGLIPISPDMWEYAIAQEIETASKLILLYYRPRDAVALLRQTEAHLTHLQEQYPQFTAYAQKARILRRMAQAMFGDQELMSMWQESQQSGDPLYLYVLRNVPQPPQQTSRQPAQAVQPQQPQQSMAGRLVRVSHIASRPINVRDPKTGRTLQQLTPTVVEYEYAVRLRLVDDQNSSAKKLVFERVRSIGGGEAVLPVGVFVLGEANPVSSFLESAFNREEME